MNSQCNAQAKKVERNGFEKSREHSLGRRVRLCHHNNVTQERKRMKQ